MVAMVSLLDLAIKRFKAKGLVAGMKRACRIHAHRRWEQSVLR